MSERQLMERKCWARAALRRAVATGQRLQLVQGLQTLQPVQGLSLLGKRLQLLQWRWVRQVLGMGCNLCKGKALSGCSRQKSSPIEFLAIDTHPCIPPHFRPTIPTPTHPTHYSSSDARTRGAGRLSPRLWPSPSSQSPFYPSGSPLRRCCSTSWLHNLPQWPAWPS